MWVENDLKTTHVHQIEFLLLLLKFWQIKSKQKIPRKKINTENTQYDTNNQSLYFVLFDKT